MSPIQDLVVLACTQAVPYPAALSQALKQFGLRGRIIQEPCSSKVEAFQLLLFFSHRRGSGLGGGLPGAGTASWWKAAPVWAFGWHMPRVISPNSA